MQPMSAVNIIAGFAFVFLYNFKWLVFTAAYTMRNVALPSMAMLSKLSVTASISVIPDVMNSPSSALLCHTFLSNIFGSSPYFAMM